MQQTGCTGVSALGPHQLRLVEAFIDIRGGYEFVMGALGDDAAVIDDDDRIGGDDGAEPMGDQETGSPFHQS